MKTKQALVAALMATWMGLAGATGTAWAWGNAPGHLSIANDLLREMGLEVTSADVFIGAAVGPDLANLKLFRDHGWGYVHDPGFAQAMLEVALAHNTTQPQWLDMAKAWAGHLAADEVVHAYLPPGDDPEHALAELAIDTCIYYGGSPYGTQAPAKGWEWYNNHLGSGFCDPQLIALASQAYRPGNPIPAAIVPVALNVLKAEIAAEYAYIKLKKNARLSRLWLKAHGYGGWPAVYQEAVEQAFAAVD